MMMIKRVGEIDVVDYSDFFKPSIVKAYFTTRLGGISQGPYASLNMSTATGDSADHVCENRERLLRGLGSPKRLIFAKQVHGNAVYIDDGKVTGLVGEYDAIVSPYKDVALMTYHADCFPVFAYCLKTGVMGMCHAGWQGVFKEIVKGLLEAMCHKLGAEMQEIRVVIGPGIGLDAYQVSQTLADQFTDKFGQEVVENRQDGPHLDLNKCLLMTLIEKGLATEQIQSSSACTYGQPSYFFSHRRDGQQTGRMVAVITK